MKNRKITMAGFLDEMKDVSYGPQSRKFCFVLGAGASQTSGIPMGSEMVDEWEAYLMRRNPETHEEWKKEHKITDKNKYEHYSKYYERRFPIVRDGYNYMERAMENAVPKTGYVVLSYLLSQTPHKVVVTTNFDHLIENAIHDFAQVMPMVIGHEAMAHYVSEQINRPTVIKIHHDLLTEPKSRTKELEGLTEPWQKALEKIFANYHPVFIGYAGNDPSLMDYLCAHQADFENKRWLRPYWLTFGNKQPTGKVKDFIMGSGGYWIPHDGFDETMYQIGKVLGYPDPDMETFLVKPRERFNALLNTFQDLKKKYTESGATVEGKTSPDAPLPSGNPPVVSEGSAAVDQPATGGNSSAADAASSSALMSDIFAILQPTDAMQLYREAVRLHNAGEYEAALMKKRKLVKLEPDNARYHDSLGVTLHKMKRYKEAQAETKKAVELEPDNARYRNSLGITLHEMKHYEEAQAEKKKAVELEPDNARYRNSLGITLYEMEEYSEALAAIQKAAELDPSNQDIQENLQTVQSALTQE